MHELYGLFADFDRARIFTLMITTVVGIGGMSWIWGNAKQANIKLTTFDWIQIYAFGLVAFLSGMLVMGMLIVPDNADALLELIRADGVVNWLTKQVQAFLLWMIRSMM